jgi:hypothetical protein
MPEGVDPSMIAGNMPSKNMDNFHNQYDVAPQGEAMNKNQSRVFSHIDTGLDQVYNHHKENNSITKV